MHLLFIFIDGLGIGLNNPTINPLARAEMPTMQRLLSGYRLVDKVAPYHNMQASLLSLDATLGVRGMPQSATGQATLLTGRNIPAEIGYHFGPWPNEAVAKYLENGNVFTFLTKAGIRAAFLNAYPQSYFDSIASGKRLYSAIPLAVTSAGISLRTTADLYAGQAISADFTAVSWRDYLGFQDAPILSPQEAGERIAYMAQYNDFSFFEYWLSDYAGHGQDMGEACDLLITLDQVFEGLLSRWNYQEGFILMTSDHGNLEDLSTRRHTTNPVPALLVGAPALRRDFIRGLTDITGIAPAILNFFGYHH